MGAAIGGEAGHFCGDARLLAGAGGVDGGVARCTVWVVPGVRVRVCSGVFARPRKWRKTHAGRALLRC